MKIIVYISALMLLLALTVAECSTPADYADNISTIITKTDKDVSEIEKLVKNGDFSRQHPTYVKTLENISESIAKLEEMKDFRGNDRLRQETMKYLKYYDNFLRSQDNTIYELMQLKNKTKEEEIELSHLIEAMQTPILKQKLSVQQAYIEFMKENELTSSSAE